MSKNQKASGITNIISYDNSGNISFVSGSTTLMSVSSSGAVLLTNTMSGGVAVSASLSANSNLLQGTGSVGFSTTASLLAVSSSQQQISSSLLTLTASYTALSSSYTALSASYNTFSGSASTRVTQIESTYATTGSNSFRANQSITGSLVVSSTITAQTLVVQTVTSSIVYSSGSNIFGSQLTDRQTFTGSIYQTGSIVAFAGSVGIGTTNPKLGLHVNSGASSSPATTGTTPNGIILFQPNDGANAIVMGAYGTSPYGNWIQSQSTTGLGTTFPLILQPTGGNVGIGTTTPGGILDVKAGTGANILVTYESTNLVAINNYSSASGFQDLKFVGANQYFYTGTAGGGSATESVRITSTGNVGIGITTDNPISNGGTYRNLLVGNGAGYGVFQGISTATATDSTIVAFSGGTTGASANKNGGSINLQLDATSTTRAIGRWVFYTNSATAFEERMRITSTGSVGIGQTNPSYLLDLKNSGTPLRIVNTTLSVNQLAWIKLRQQDGPNFGADIGIDTTTGGDFVIGRNDGTDTFTEAFRIKRSNGYVGIGTTSISGIFQAGVANAGIYFDVSTQYTPKIKAAGTISDIQIESVGSGGNVYLNAPGATSLIALSTAGAERLRVSSGGLVTKPYQMFVMGGMVSDQTITTSSPTKLNFVANGSYSWYNQNVGSCWNNSTYTLTAPVTGIYIVNVSILQSAVGPNQIALYVNGSRKHSIPISTSTTYLGGGSAMAILQAGDTLDLRVFNDVTTITLIANAYHSWFNMYLLG